MKRSPDEHAEDSKTSSSKKSKQYQDNVLEQKYPGRLAAYKKSLQHKPTSSAGDDKELEKFDKAVDDLADSFSNTMNIRDLISPTPRRGLDTVEYHHPINNENLENYRILPARMPVDFNSNHSAMLEDDLIHPLGGMQSSSAFFIPKHS